MNRIYLLLTLTAVSLRAELQLPAIIGDHMVLQQKLSNPIWGWDTPGTQMTVAFAGQTHWATAGLDGRWQVKLLPVAANGMPHTLIIHGTSKREIQDILVGEVWMCSGQSNMAFALAEDFNGDLEAAASNLPQVRLIKVPAVGAQEPQKNFNGRWTESTPETARAFSAVGFLFGRYLHAILGVPIGLIDNSWGGSTAEAWVRRESLEKDPRFALLRETAAKREADIKSGKAQIAHEQALAEWTEISERAKAAGRPVPRKPSQPQQWLVGNGRPGNIFAGMVHPTLGFGLKGVIWYQGESNASRAYEHADLFPFLIEQWRQEWQQGDLSFYWVQLPDFRPEKPAPSESEWAEFRETQSKALQLPHTGQAVIIDLGEAKDGHPKNKHEVASRLVRWALARDYGMKMAHRSPEFKHLAVVGATVTVTFDCFGSSLRPFDVAEPRGFALCGPDRVWHWATGTIVAPDKVELRSDQVSAPIAVRYAWADNPICNLYSMEGLPATPFRTDDFEMITKPRAAPLTVTR